MMLKHSVITALLAMLLFTNCKKQEMPDNDSAVITEEYVIGNWVIKSAKSYLKVSDPIASMSVNYCEKLLDEKLSKEASGKILCFTNNGKAYCIEEGVLKGNSDFYVDEENTVYFTTNPDVLGFYIPHFYMKKNEEDVNKMTVYLGKKESLDLLANDGSVDSYMGMIKNLIKDAQCEIRFERDYTDYSHLY